MGIDIRWEDERGEVLAKLPDPNFLVAKFLPRSDDQSFSCLRFADPAGDTIFNQAQIHELISELEKIAVQKKHRQAIQEHLEAVLEFTRQSVGRVHTYIKFYGD